MSIKELRLAAILLRIMVPLDFSTSTIYLSSEKLALVAGRASARLLGQGVWPRQTWLDLLASTGLDS